MYLLSAISYEARTIASGVLMCLVAALSIAIIVLVLLQKGSGDGVSAITGNSGFGGDSEVGSSRKLLRTLTIVFSVVLAIASIVFFVVAATN